MKDSTSNIQTIEDCLLYDNFSSDTSKWINNNSNLTYSNTGLTIQSKSYRNYSFILSNDSFEDVVIETSSPDWIWYQIGLCDINNNITTLLGNYPPDGLKLQYSTSSGNVEDKIRDDLSGGEVVKLEYHNSMISVYVDDVYLTSVTCIDKGQQIRIIGWGYIDNRVGKVSYVKIKPYSL